MRNVIIADHSLLFSPGLHIEQNDVIMIEQMQSNLSKFDFDKRPDCSRNLFIIKEARQNLKPQALFLPHILQYYGETIRFTELLVQSDLSFR